MPEFIRYLVALLTRRTRGGWWLPVICLVGPGRQAGLRTLAARFAVGGTRQAPHAELNAAGYPADPDGLRRLLHEAYRQLATGPFGPDVLRFRRFALLESLIRENLAGTDVADRRSVLARRIMRRRTDPYARAGTTVAGWWGLLLRLVPVVVYRILISGRVPGTIHRWFITQEYLAPRQDGTFLAFADRLTADRRGDQDADEVAGLLVHAFLADLRVAHRRRPWRLRAWRRTAYPAILLDRVADDNAGALLARTVAAVRNRVGQNDPLLLVTASAMVRRDPVVVPLAGVEHVHGPWLIAAQAARRRGDDDGWFLTVELPAGVGGGLLPHVERPRPPLFALRPVLAAVLLVPLLAAGGWAGSKVHQGCLPWHRSGTVDVRYLDGQCIGYSGTAEQFFGTDPETVATQAKAFEQNGEVARSRAKHPNRPLATIVYLAAFTAPGGPAAFVAERQGLQGVVAAQHRARHEAESSAASPYLRVIVANVGNETRHGGDLVPLLRELLDDDPTIVAAVAQLDSRTTTRTMLESLDAAGLPTITLTTSADGIAGTSNQYLQLSPANRQEAAMLRGYTVSVLHRQKLINYYTYGSSERRGAGEDLYVDTLRADVAAEFRGGYQEKFWVKGAALTDACADVSDAVVFFGGRYSDFAAFVNQLFSDCGGHLPPLLGDASVGRYLADPAMRETAPTTYPLAYVSRGQLGFCRQLEAAREPERTRLLVDIRASLNLCAGGRPIGEWVGLGYDGARLVQRAVQDLASRRAGDAIDDPWDPDQINATMVYSQIRQNVALRPYRGVNGPITFSLNGIADTRRFSILCATDLRRAFTTDHDVPAEVFRTGAGYPGEAKLTPRPCLP